MRIILGGAFFCVAGMAQAATLSNGDFTNLFEGYTLEACGFSLPCDRDPGPYFFIRANGPDPYLEVRSGPTLLGSVEASAVQSVEITPTSNLLTFDAVRFPILGDPSSSGTSLLPDVVSVVVIDEAERFSFLFDIEETRIRFNPFGDTGFDVSATPASDPFFSTGVAADLSGFEGQTVTFGIFAFNENDGTLLVTGFDNFAFSAVQVAPIPLPAGVGLLLSGLAALGLWRRKTR